MVMPRTAVRFRTRPLGHFELKKFGSIMQVDRLAISTLGNHHKTLNHTEAARVNMIRRLNWQPECFPISPKVPILRPCCADFNGNAITVTWTTGAFRHTFSQLPTNNLLQPLNISSLNCVAMREEMPGVWRIPHMTTRICE